MAKQSTIFHLFESEIYNRSRNIFCFHFLSELAKKNLVSVHFVKCVTFRKKTALWKKLVLIMGSFDCARYAGRT